MKKIALIITGALFLITTLKSQSVTDKAKVILKPYPARPFTIPYEDSLKALLIGFYVSADTLQHHTRYLEKLFDSLSTELRFNAIADSADYFKYISFSYRDKENSKIKDVVFRHFLTDKIYQQRKKKRKP